MSACGCDTSGLKPVDEAIGELLARVPALPPVEHVALSDALGRVLAESLDAPFPVPAWDNSAMDGYALRAADLPADDSSEFADEGTVAHHIAAQLLAAVGPGRDQ